MYYRRSAWTNKPNNSVAFKGIQTSITFHYPGFGNHALQTKNWNLQKCFNQIRTWENQHQARGSKNIEYNFFVLPTGDVVEGRGFRQSGANGNSAANRYSISVQVLIGDNEPLNSKFLKGIAEALKLIKQHQPKALNKFYPHKHWVGTRCPGPAIEAALRNGTINKNMAEGSINIPVGSGASVPAPRPIQSSNLWETSPTIKSFTKEQTKQLQNDLIKAGFSVGSYGADGSYKGDTIKAVKAFQKKHKLAIDGVAGPKTLLKLGEVLKGSTTVSKPSTSVSKPSTKKLKVDGRFGTETVKELQRRVGVKVDGRAGTNTWTALQKKKRMKYVDGIISKQSYKAEELGNGIVAGKSWNYTGRGSAGSSVIKAIQKDLGVAQDGILYTGTIKALQTKLNNDPNYLK